jgi:hypothetical protein
MFLFKSHIVYPSIYYRILFYLLSAHFIIAYGEPENLFELLKLPYYYFALMGSFVITMIISEYILAVTKYLDVVYLRFSEFNKRISLQIIWGVIATVLLTVVLATLYFLFRGRNIVTEGYFRYDFTVVVCFILFLNAFYLILGLMQNRRYQNKIRIPNKEKPKDDIGRSSLGIMAIYPTGRGFIAILKNGESIIWTKTLEQSLHELPKEEYFLINRSDIVSRAIIEGYKPGDSRRLKLILKEPLASGRAFIVSQRKVVEFKRWYRDDQA